MEKDVFRLVSSEIQRKSSMRNRTSNLHIPRADALPLSHREFYGEQGPLQSSYNWKTKFDPIRYLIVSQYELSKPDKNSQLMLRI